MRRRLGSIFWFKRRHLSRKSWGTHEGTHTGMIPRSNFSIHSMMSKTRTVDSHRRYWKTISTRTVSTKVSARLSSRHRHGHVSIGSRRGAYLGPLRQYLPCALRCFFLIADLFSALRFPLPHVPESSFLRVGVRVTLPIHFPRCLEVLSKADKDRPSRTSAFLPVAILQLYYRHHCFPPRPSPRI